MNIIGILLLYVLPVIINIKLIKLFQIIERTRINKIIKIFLIFMPVINISSAGALIIIYLQEYDVLKDNWLSKVIKYFTKEIEKDKQW